MLCFLKNIKLTSLIEVIILVDLDSVMDTLIEISKEKSVMLERVYKLTMEQKEVIEEMDIASLNNVIDKKQAEINEIQQLDVKFETIVSDLKTVYDIGSLDELRFCTDKVIKVKEVVTGIMEKLRAIHELELENMNIMKSLKDELETKINHTNTGKRAISNYEGINEVQTAVFFDKSK